MRRFFGREDGYVLVLVLIMMPIFIGLCVLVIDVGRGNNTHSDLYAAADALSLAGARELDSGVDAIDRSKLAMAKLTNSVSFLGNQGGGVSLLTFDDTSTNTANEGFTVFFLTDIPDDDNTPIDQAFVDANFAADDEQDLAKYVYVTANTNNFSSLFFRMAAFANGPVKISARAVATRVSAACDVTPIYICNPFEDGGLSDGLQASFSQGKLHGRMLTLHLSGNQTQSPGNFGFLSVNGTSSASAIREVFASGVNPTCYESGTVRTKPGGANAIRQGINVRFDIYDGPFNSKKNDPDYPPAQNVRKGYTYGGNACNASLEGDPAVAMGFPPNTVNDSPINGIPGALIGAGDWDMAAYWDLNHAAGGTPFTNFSADDLDDMNSFPFSEFPTIFPGSSLPSRYDVYRYEIEKDEELAPAPGPLSHQSPGGEQGNPMCSSATPPDKDRRVMFAAIVNCNSDEVIDEGGGVNTYPVEAYASFFMVNPMPSGSPATINVEIIDITGFGGNGTLDEFVRDEPVLVR